MVVENRPGAGGHIGSAWVAKQAPRDGSVWLATVNSAQSVNPALHEQPGCDPIADFEPVAAALPYVKDGRLKPIAVPSRTRAAALPDVPLAPDAVPGLDGELWVGIYGPKGVSREALDAMRAGVAKVPASADWEAFCATQGATALKADAAELATMTRQELERRGPVVRESGMQID